MSSRRALFVWGILSALLLGRLFLADAWKRPVASDGYYYYVWLTSVWFDHDLDLTNNYAGSGNPWGAGTTRTGYADNIFPVGCAALWLPFFAGTQSLHAMVGFDANVSPGMSLWEQRGTVLGTLIYGLVGLVLLYHVCRRYATGPVVTLALSCVLWGTFLPYYLAAKPSMSEGNSFFTQALFLFLLSRARSINSWKHGLLLGVVLGLSTAVRYHNMASGWLILPLLVRLAMSAGGGAVMRAAFWLFIGFVVGVSPQAYVLLRLYGTPFSLGTATFFFDASHVLRLPSVLLSPDRGLFYWHPVSVLAIAGLICIVGSKDVLDRHLLICFALFTIANSLGTGVGSAFGARRFSGAIPLLAVGTSVLLERFCGVDGRRRRLMALSLVAPTILWSLFLWQALGEKLRSTEPAHFDMLFSSPSGEGYPARQRGFYLGREIKVGGRRFRGWGPVELDGEVSYRRISADRASIPARASAGEGLRVRIRARALGAGPALLEVSFGRTTASAFRLGLEWAEYTCLLSPTDSDQAEQLSELWFHTPLSAGPNTAVAVSSVSWERVLPSE